METRLLTSSDLAAFRAIWMDGLTRFPMAFLFDVADLQAMSDDVLTELLDSQKRLGLFENELLIGFAGIGHRDTPRMRHRATLGPFYVEPAYHGTGAAQALMQGCLDIAQAKGVWLIDLFVAEDNIRAMRFYENHGFQREGRMPAAVVVDGVAQDDFYYCLTLPH